jgi:hypothetical protein
MKLTAIATTAALFIVVPHAHATDSICKAVAMHATIVTETFHYALKRGETVDAVTAYRTNKKTGVSSLCSHGGGCYPAEALRLTNCKVNKSKPYDYGDEVDYELILIRSKVPADVLRQNDVELKLLDLGMCNACADNAAAFYVKMPNSRCAMLVRKALVEGDPTAIEKLRDAPDYCME